MILFNSVFVKEIIDVDLVYNQGQQNTLAAVKKLMTGCVTRGVIIGQPHFFRLIK